GKGLGMKVFGTVPPVNSDGGASPVGEASLAEAIDTARTMLLYGAHGNSPPKTVLVTSALPGEGKTSLSGHLAISLARGGYRTLLVDGDLRSPSNHHVFDVPVTPGLCELLRGESMLDPATQPTRFPGLTVLPAGRWSLAATQALAGDRWAAIRAAVETQYDFVVIDSAPVLPVVDSLLLARHVDGVLLSVMHDHSRVAAVAEAQHRLLSIGANVLGVVLNGVEPHGRAYGYGYGYGYRADPTGPVETVPA
ncbi:MAG: CpsD/CapB family tyrosine-protein kinase, partial [Zavarzinella sp.]|nr:CpsD/CapB family tyrosine-protein kinase [Zavarzinella sp.]